MGGDLDLLIIPPLYLHHIIHHLKNNMRNSKEWIAVLDGKRIDSNGFYCGAACVTSYNKKEAIRLLSKAKMHYFGTYKINKEVRKNTNIYAN